MAGKQREEFDEDEFIASVARKHGLDIVVPAIEDPSYLDLAIRCFRDRRDGETLIATSLVAKLIKHCWAVDQHETLLELGSRFLPLLFSGGEQQDDLEVTAQELRSALFWRYLHTDYQDLRLLKAESELMGALCGCSADAVLNADAALSHGWRRDALLGR